MNTVAISGHLGKDTTAIFGEGASKRALFQVANNRKYTDKSGNKQTVTNWIPCIAWGVLADLMQKYGLKGRHVEVTGSLDCFQKPVNDNGSYDNPIIQVRVGNIEFTAFEDNVKELVEREKAEATGVAGKVQVNEGLAAALIQLLNANATAPPAPAPAPEPVPQPQAQFSPEQLAGLVAALQPQAQAIVPEPTPEPSAQERAAALLAGMVG